MAAVRCFSAESDGSMSNAGALSGPAATGPPTQRPARDRPRAARARSAAAAREGHPLSRAPPTHLVPPPRSPAPLPFLPPPLPTTPTPPDPRPAVDITKYFMGLDAAAPAAAKAELPTTLSKLTGRSGDLTRELFAAGAKGKNFDKIVKDLEGFVAAVEKAGMVVDRFFTTPNYSEAECRKVVDLLMTSKEPLASFASIKDAEVKDVIVDNEANVATWLAARKAVAALQLSEPVAAAIAKMAAEGNLLRVKLVARKAAEVRATTAKSLDVVVSSAVALSRAQQEAVTKALPAYVQAGAGQALAPVFVVDPAVMGGLLVSFKNLSIDLSASTRLVEVAAAHAKMA